MLVLILLFVNNVVINVPHVLPMLNVQLALESEKMPLVVLVQLANMIMD